MAWFSLIAYNCRGGAPPANALKYTSPLPLGKRSACPTTHNLLIRSQVGFLAPDRKPRTGHTSRGRKAMRLREVVEGKASANRRGNSKLKMLPVYGAKIRS